MYCSSSLMRANSACPAVSRNCVLALTPLTAPSPSQHGWTELPELFHTELPLLLSSALRGWQSWLFCMIIQNEKYKKGSYILLHRLPKYRQLLSFQDLFVGDSFGMEATMNAVYTQLWGLQRTLGDTSVQLFSPVSPPPLDGVEFSVLYVREREAPHFRSTPATALAYILSLSVLFLSLSFSPFLQPLLLSSYLSKINLSLLLPRKNTLCQRHKRSRTGSIFLILMPISIRIWLRVFSIFALPRNFL
jgi:hypothetical protein